MQAHPLTWPPEVARPSGSAAGSGGRPRSGRSPAEVRLPLVSGTVTGLSSCPGETPPPRGSEMPGNVGLTEIIIVLVVALLVFGPKKLPEMGRGLGKGMREFKDSLSGDHHEDDVAKPAPAPAQALPPAA